jgi:V/A-type H+-transporting ATPase subunit K
MKRYLLLAAILVLFTALIFSHEEENGQNIAAAAETSVWKYFAAALAVGVSCISGGLAVGRIGAAAMGAMSENPELSGKALPYAGLAEGICLWGFLVALLIIIF